MLCVIYNVLFYNYYCYWTLCIRRETFCFAYESFRTRSIKFRWRTFLFIFFWFFFGISKFGYVPSFSRLTKALIKGWILSWVEWSCKKMAIKISCLKRRMSNLVFYCQGENCFYSIFNYKMDNFKWVEHCLW